MPQSVELLFLGTGDKCGVPKIGCDCPTCTHAKTHHDKTERLRTGYVLLVDNQPIFIDAGPDLRVQMLKHNLSWARSVFITHPHYDHISGLHEFYRVTRDFDLFGLPSALEYIINKLGFRFLRFTPHSLTPYEPVKHLGLVFTPFLVDHRMWEGMQAIGYSIEWKGFKLVMTGDTTKNIPQESLDLIQDPDLFIADAFAAEVMFDGLPHMVLPEAIELANQIHARKAIFTHSSHRTPIYTEYNLALQKKYPHYQIAYDGMRCILP